MIQSVNITAELPNPDIPTLEKKKIIVIELEKWISCVHSSNIAEIQYLKENKVLDYMKSDFPNLVHQFESYEQSYPLESTIEYSIEDREYIARQRLHELLQVSNYLNTVQLLIINTGWNLVYEKQIDEKKKKINQSKKEVCCSLF